MSSSPHSPVPLALLAALASAQDGAENVSVVVVNRIGRNLGYETAGLLSAMGILEAQQLVRVPQQGQVEVTYEGFALLRRGEAKGAGNSVNVFGSVHGDVIAGNKHQSAATESQLLAVTKALGALSAHRLSESDSLTQQVVQALRSLEKNIHESRDPEALGKQAHDTVTLLERLNLITTLPANVSSVIAATLEIIKQLTS